MSDSTENSSAPIGKTPVEQRLIDFLNEETIRTRRGVSMTYSLGIVASILVAGYMFFILKFVNEAIEPRTLAGFVGMQAEETLPKVIENTEQALVGQANELAEQTSRDFIRLVPKFREQGVDFMDRALNEGIPYLSTEFSTIISDYIDANADELKEFADSHSNDEFATFFTEELVAELTKQLDQHLALQFDGRSIDYFHDNLTLSLMAMDQTLNELLNANPEDLDRRQRLQRRLLARLFHSAVAASESQ